jgi:DNA helicase II / ATP-dependent DNA helicase PcrA
MNIQDKINQAELSGGIVITASAGTGKTYCLVEKVKYLILQGINPVNILCFTFTQDAAQEFRNRIPNNETMTIGTIHAISLKIIKENSPKRYFVLDNGMQHKFVFDIFKELKIDFDKYNKYLSRIDLAKNIFLDYYNLIEDNDQLITSFFDDNNKLISFAREFEIKKEKQHKITFSDMQLKAYNILKNNPSILDNRQERWKYIFLDEAQDASNVDVALVSILAQKYHNLFVVGDVKQQIFQFRTGGNNSGLNGVSLMKNFKDIYPDASIFTLGTTYRNAKSICDIGNKIASKIDNSNIDTANQSLGKVTIIQPFESQLEEAIEICNLAIKAFNQDKTVRIIYRTNAQSLTFQKIMLQENIPYSINQTTSIFYTKEAKTAIACCEFAFEYDKLTLGMKIACLKNLKPLIANKFELYALTKKMQELTADCFANPYPFHNDSKTERIIDELIELKETFSHCQSISDVFNFVGKICKDDDSFSDNAEDNLIGIAEFASECKSLGELNQLIDQISKPRLLAPGEKAISLSTIHGAKGLENLVVFITGIVNDCFPHKNGETLEELNLFYVAITRAKSELYLSSFLSFGRKEYSGTTYIDMIR